MIMQPHDQQRHDRPEDADETILRVVAALKPLPSADPRAVARVLSAVHGRAPEPTPQWREFLDWMRAPSLSMVGATGLVAVALLAGYLAKGGLRSGSNTAGSGNQSGVTANAVGDSGVQSNSSAAAGRAVAGNAGGAVPVLPASTVADAERALPVQFVLDLPNAHTVSVVGDFNDWTVDQAPMQKFANGAWSITLPVKPGRHEYAFVVDGTRWMADPRAPKARDNEFGKPGSVIVVTTP